MGLWTASGSVQADPHEDVPADVLTAAGDSQAFPLPAPPTGFVEEQVGPVRWTYPTNAATDAQQLQEALPDLWRQVTSELGAQFVAPELTVRIARGPSDMKRLAPKGAPPPDYAVGVAYPARGLIILSMVSPTSWLPPHMESVLTHELSHVALHRAVDGKHVPLWLAEGLAVHQAGEQNITRIRTLWQATVNEGLIPLRQLSHRFPSRSHEVNIAYAQSADLVGHLLSVPDDRLRLQRALRAVAKGGAFEQAIQEQYYVDLEYLEREWRASLRDRFTATPLLLTGGSLWALLAFVLAWAFVKRRRDHKSKLNKMAKQEEREDRTLALLQLQHALQRDSANDGARAPAKAPPPPPPGALRGDSGVPTIQHDGESHTLH